MILFHQSRSFDQTERQGRDGMPEPHGQGHGGGGLPGVQYRQLQKTHSGGACHMYSQGDILFKINPLIKIHTGKVHRDVYRDIIGRLHSTDLQ